MFEMDLKVAYFGGRERFTPLAILLIYWALINSLNIDANKKYQQS
jgi:hypothetical protein